MKKGSKLYSILRFKCPYCHEGEFFIDKNPYKFRTIGDVRTECNVCHRSYAKEPGFFQGAMYVSYALGVALFVGSFLIAYLIDPEASPGFYISIVIGSIILLTPLLFALSKIIYANIFMNFLGVEKKANE